MSRVQPMLIGGEWVTGTERRAVTDPQSGDVLALVPEAQGADIRRALDSAVTAARSARSGSVAERSALLRRVSQHVDAHAERFAHTIASEGIKTIREARREVSRAVITLRVSAEEAERLGGGVIPFSAYGGHDKVGMWFREPVGVVLAITPFNDPLNLVAHKAGPAIAAGNAVIVKPHELTPLSALLLAEGFVACGAPAGLIQVVTGAGATVGRELVRSSGVRLISFTGGYATGAAIARDAGPRPLALELGNNAAAIVLEDADLDEAIPRLASAAFSAAGQNCLHLQRVLISRDIYGTVRDRFLDATKEIRLGSKLDEDVDMGCLIDERSAQRVDAVLADAVDSGARVLGGGLREGVNFAPTVVDCLPHTHELYRSEIFAPITVLQPVDDVHQAVALANDVDFGLQASVFTRSIDRAFQVASALDFGMVLVNESPDYRIDAMPFGGRKQSGIGLEGVRFAVEAMTETKAICLVTPPPPQGVPPTPIVHDHSDAANEETRYARIA